MWDTRTWETAHVLQGHERNVQCVSFSPDGQWLASGDGGWGDGNKIRLWDVKTREMLSATKGHKGRILTLAFSPDGRLLASGDSDKAVRLWNAPALTPARVIAEFSEAPSFVAFDETGDALFVLSTNLVLLETATGTIRGGIFRHTDDVRSIAFSPDGRFIVSGSDDRTVKVWEVESGRLLRSLEGHAGSVNAVAVSPDGRFIVSGGSWDTTVKVWKVESGRLLHSQEGHTGPVNAVAVSPDGRTIVSGSSDRTVKVWDAESGRLLRSLEGHTDWVRAVTVSPDGRTIVSGSDDRTVKVWDAKSGRLLRSLEGHTAWVWTVAVSPDGRLLASGGQDKSVRLWEMNSGRLVYEIAGHFRPVAIIPLTERRIALAGGDGSIEIWNSSDWQQQSATKPHSGRINALAYCARTGLLVGGSDDKSLGLLDTTTREYRLIRQELHCLRANIFGVRGLRPDQRTLMLRKGAVEIDPRELREGWSAKSNREVIRIARLRTLAREVSEAREKRRPVVLIIGPGTFLPEREYWDVEDYEWLMRFLPMPPEMISRDVSEAQMVFEHLYERLLMDPDYFEMRFGQRSRLPSSKEKRPYPKPALGENYAALSQLVNEQVFSIVLDLDVFSQPTQDMFPTLRGLESRYKEYDDLEFALERLRRNWRYVEKGESRYFKLFSKEWLRSAKTRERDPFRLRRVFEDLLARMFYEFEGQATVIWTGFYLRGYLRFARFPERERREQFYWVIDETIRETDIGQLPAIYLDYRLGSLSNVFRDLYGELRLIERGRIGVDLVQLKQWATKGSPEERARAAGELVSLLISDFPRYAPVLLDLIHALRRDFVPEVRRAVVQAILENYTRLPDELQKLVPEFASDPQKEIRADVARWILLQYPSVGKDYDSLLQGLAQDKSPLVRQVIVDTVTSRFEQLPTSVRLLASQIVGAQIEVQMIKGGGMLVGRESDLVLRITNHNENPLESVEVEIIQPSAEYEVLSTNPIVTDTVGPGQVVEVTFRLKTKVARQIAINYRINGELKEPPLYINAIKDNPYIYGDPVRDDLMFFGRAAEIEEILQAITKPAKQDILVVGERRTGKTSLLYQLQRRLARPFIPVFAELYVCKPDTASVLQYLLNKIIEHLINEKLLAPEWKEHHFESAYFKESVGEILAAARENLADIKIVLLIDEADYFLEIRPRYFPWRVDPLCQNILRSTLQSDIGADLRAVIAGSNALLYYVSQHSSPFFNHFKPVRLKPLTRDQTQELITRPAASLGYSYSPSAIERIIELSGGQPYYCQALCYEAFANALKNNRLQITDEDVNVAEVARLEDLYPSFLSYFWNRTNRAERRFLSRLAKKEPLNQVKTAAVQRLIDWGLIIQSEDGYKFASGLFEKWTTMALNRR